MIDLRLLVFFVNKLYVVSIVDEANVDQISFSYKCAIEPSAPDPSERIFLYALGHHHIVRLQLSYHRTYSGEKWRNDLLISIPGVYGLSSLAHYQEMLSYLVKFSQLFIHLHVIL